MKLTIAVLAALVALVPVNAGPVRELRPADIGAAWLKFKNQFGKSYRSEDEQNSRKAIFEESLKRVHELNHNNEDSFERGINFLSDHTSEELKVLNGLRVSKEKLGTKARAGYDLLKSLPHYTDVSPPETVDWTTQPSRVGPVKYQGKCGSCWAFATVGLFEGQEGVKTNISKVVMLSEQQFLDCDSYDNGCNGGMPDSAIDYVKEVGGIDTEVRYQYEDTPGECRFDKSQVFESTKLVIDSQFLEQDEELLKHYVAHYGPVLVGIDASHKSFRDYKSGVYYEKNCTDNIDHAVLVVGYGVDEKQGAYWLIKNSWSEEWGMNGYMRLARNRNNHCGIVSMATIVV